MLKTTQLWDYLVLGERLWSLQRPHPATKAEDLNNEVSVFLSDLTKCDLPRSRAVAQTLHDFLPNVYVDSLTRVLDQMTFIKLMTLMDPIQKAVRDESLQKHTVVLNTSGVSTKLRDLPNQLALTDTQRHLLDETVRCIECEAYRAAMVTSWNLAYEWIRQWVYDHKLTEFNAQLTTNYCRKDGSPVYAPIKDYADFWDLDPAPGESVVLDCMRAGNLIGGTTHQDLRRHLRQRNSYAHPNFKLPTMTKANAFIEELVDIITATPFK